MIPSQTSARAALSDVASILQISTTAIGGAGVIAALVTRNYNSDWNIWLATAGTAIFCTSLLVLIFRILIWRGRYAELYTTLERHQVYQIDPTDIRLHTYTINLRIRSLTDGLQSLNMKYAWSGTGNHTASCTASNGRSVVQWSSFVTIEGYTYYNICLERSLRAGEECQITIEHVLHDTGRTFTPQLSMSPNRTIRKLRMDVVVPRNHKLTRIYGRRMKGSIFASRRSKNIDLANNTAAGMYSIQVRKLRGKRTLGIFWEWEY